MSNPIRPEPDFDVEAVRVKVRAEIEARRAEGIEPHGCEPNVEPDGPVEHSPEMLAELRRMGDEWMAQLRREHPGPWLGDPMSNAERMAHAAFALGKAKGVIPADEPFILRG